MTKKAKKEFSEQRGVCWLLTGLLCAPLAFLTQLTVNYAVVPRACSSGHAYAPHLVTILFLLIALAGGFVAWRNWRDAGQVESGEGGGRVERSRFLAVMGLLLSGLITLVFIAQWIPQFLISPCQR